MNIRAVLLITLAVLAPASLCGDAFAQTILERSQRDDTVSVPADDPAMAAAFRKARASLDGFLALLDARPAHVDGYAAKLRVIDKEETEYFWVIEPERDGDRFVGILSNTPRSVKNVYQGQVMYFSRGDIFDWTYIDTVQQRTMGNFTLCALLTRRTPEAAAAYRKERGLTCD